MRNFVASCAAILAVATFSNPLLACGISRCRSAEIAPGEGLVVPANVPSLLYRAGIGDTDQTDERAARVELFDASGMLVALRAEAVAPDGSGEFLFHPTLDLTEGEDYELRYPDVGCDSADPAVAPLATRTFRAGAAAALPQVAGTLTISQRRFERTTIATSSGSCLADASTSVVTAAVTPSSELVPYLATTQFVLSVDGKSSGGRAYGTFALGDPIEMDLRTTCGSDDPGVYPGIPAGHHHVEIAAHVAGSPSDPSPLAFDFDASCDDSRSASGCQLSSSGGNSPPWIGLLAAGALSWTRRTRRRRGATINE